MDPLQRRLGRQLGTAAAKRLGDDGSAGGTAGASGRFGSAGAGASGRRGAPQEEAAAEEAEVEEAEETRGGSFAAQRKRPAASAEPAAPLSRKARKRLREKEAVFGARRT